MLYFLFGVWNWTAFRKVQDWLGVSGHGIKVYHGQIDINLPQGWEARCMHSVKLL